MDSVQRQRPPSNHRVRGVVGEDCSVNAPAQQSQLPDIDPGGFAGEISQRPGGRLGTGESSLKAGQIDGVGGIDAHGEIEPSRWSSSDCNQTSGVMHHTDLELPCLSSATRSARGYAA